MLLCWSPLYILVPSILTSRKHLNVVNIFCFTTAGYFKNLFINSFINVHSPKWLVWVKLYWPYLDFYSLFAKPVILVKNNKYFSTFKLSLCWIFHACIHPTNSHLCFNMHIIFIYLITCIHIHTYMQWLSIRTINITNLISTNYSDSNLTTAESSIINSNSQHNIQ